MPLSPKSGIPIDVSVVLPTWHDVAACRVMQRLKDIHNYDKSIHMRTWMKDKRRQLGLSQAEFAKKVGVSERTVQRWEAGAVAPDDENRQDIALVFEMEECEVEAKFGHETKSFDQVGFGLISALTRSSVSLETVGALENLTFQYALSYGRLAPEELLPHILSRLAELRAVLAEPQTIKVRRRVVSLVGVLSALAGNLYHDLGDRPHAAMSFQTAKLAGAEAEDSDLAAHVCAIMGLCAYFDEQPQIAVSLTAEGILLSQRRSSAPRRAWIRALHARSLASAGDARGALEHLESAYSELESRCTNTEYSPVDFFDLPRLLALSGETHLRNGDASEAINILKKALSLRSAKELKSRMLIELDLASCLLIKNGPEEAIFVASGALLQGKCKGALVAPVLRKAEVFRRNLSSFGAPALAAEFDELVWTEVSLSGRSGA